MEFDVVVVGGGISGSSTGFHLSSLGFRVCIIEAKDVVSILSEFFFNIRKRFGGRCETQRTDIKGKNYMVDTGNHFLHTDLFLRLGGQWIAPNHMHPRVNRLCKEIGIKINPQMTEGNCLIDLEGIRKSFQVNFYNCASSKSHRVKYLMFPALKITKHW